MPSALIALAVLAVVLIAVLVMWTRARSARKPNVSLSDMGEKRGQSRRENRSGTPLAKAESGGPKLDLPEASTLKKAFDPDATQIYKRPPPVAAPATLPNREGTSLAGACMIGLSGRQRGKTFSIPASGVTIGRSPSCEIVLDDQRVSLRHAWVGIIDGKAVLRDLESTNGTFLNTNTQTPVRKVELCAGDTIFFGGHQSDQFRFLATKPESQPSEAIPAQ